MDNICKFSRKFFMNSSYSYIGEGSLGGKAEGLKLLHKIAKNTIFTEYSEFEVSIPRTIVISSATFDQFMEQNDLYPFALSEMDDRRITQKFQKASLPPDILGDIREIATNIKTPLAVRSSSLLEDSAKTPMAGIYATKMIPGNQPNADTRFLKLTDAIKLIYASTFYSGSKSAMTAIGNDIYSEKMAVIIQDVAGILHNKRFYPDISGVARTFNYYPTGHAESKDGVISLALGLGKFIVDGGNPWPYSPAYPSSPPPYKSINDMIKNTQTDCWAINMDRIKEYNPVSEAEYLIKLTLKEAEYDNTLKFAASTYDPYSDRLYPGISGKGPRVITFAPILQNMELPLNNLLIDLMKVCEEELKSQVEIEFALTISVKSGIKNKLEMLQVRPLNISGEKVFIDFNAIRNENIIVKSRNSMGNGRIQDIRDIVFITPDDFEFKNSRTIAREIEAINKQMLVGKRRYMLIGFGRWGSSDPWLGIPVNWSMISGVGVIIEASLQGRPVDMSQGSHFFHNIANLKIPYICIDDFSGDFLNWEWLNKHCKETISSMVKSITLDSPLKVMIDGRVHTGVICR
ncbi:MAG: hypothetical protein J7L71_07750 [Spirochaetaceae bacterium]|nr:hypothetical protein [Spirochaetaceae bacterium]